MRLLQRRETGAEYLENLLAAELEQAPLAPVDRALAQELAYGVARWQGTLDWLIARKTGGRPQKPTLRILLRLGLYQLLWLERIPDHAAVNETVALARQLGFNAEAGFVNALLRGYAREKEPTRQLLKECQAKDLAVGYSQPAWLIARWSKRWGVPATTQLLEWNNTPPKTYARLNQLRADASQLLARWREENVEYDFGRWDWVGENLVFELKSHRPLAKLKSFQEGWFYVQDPSTLLAVVTLDPQPGETVLDLCAAPGGKTSHIAQLMRNQGRIIAADSSGDRLRLLAENCARLGVTCVEPVLAATLEGRKPTRVDRVLVDAPCSNTGVMGRRVDLRWRIRPEELERLGQAQLALLHRAATWLGPGGTLVYSTCSLEPEENQELSRKFLAQHPEYTLESERELIPFTDRADGAYVARMRCGERKSVMREP